MSSKSLDFNEISSNAMMQFSKHPPQSPLNKGGIKEGYALQELHHNTPLIPPLSRGELKGGVACNPAHAGQATMPLINAFFGLNHPPLTPPLKGGEINEEAKPRGRGKLIVAHTKVRRAFIHKVD